MGFTIYFWFYEIGEKIGTSNYVKGYYTYIGHPKRWCIRLAALYKKYEGVCWFNKTTPLRNPLPEKIHPLTIHFIKNNVYALMALVSHPSLDFGEFQKITSKTKVSNDSTLNELLEVNLVMRFLPFTKDNIIIDTYKGMRNIIKYNNLETMQMHPDVIMDWTKQSIYFFRGILGIDQKNRTPTVLGRNLAICNPIQNYEDVLNDFERCFFLKHRDISMEAIDALEALKKTQNDPDEHLKIWAQTPLLFPDKWKPPLLLQKTFDESHLSPDIVELLRNGESRIIHVSDALYALEKQSEKL